MRNGIRVSLIAAVADNGVIGEGRTIPWRLSTDMRRLRKLTLGKPVVMGRKTFQTLPAPLDGRLNVVVSARRGYRPDGAAIYPSVEAALAAAVVAAKAEVMVIGGGEIYAATMELADRLYVTHVALQPAGDVFFPEIDSGLWKRTSEDYVPAGESDSAASRFVVYDRVRPATG